MEEFVQVMAAFVEGIPGVAEFVVELFLPVFTKSDSRRVRESKIHPTLRPGAESLNSRRQMGMGGRL